MDLNELIAQRARVWEQMKEIRERAKGENRDMTAEEESSWDKAERDLEELSSKIKREETHHERARQMAEFGNGGGNDDPAETGTPSDAYRDAFIAYARGGMEALSGEQRDALRGGYVAPESRAQGVGTNSAGGYLVPQGFRNVFIETLDTLNALRRAGATIIPTDSGNSMTWPTVNDTANKGALLAENTQVTEQDVVMGQADLGAYKFTSKLIRVSLELLEDSGTDVEALLGRLAGNRIARIENEYYTTGTGTAQPQGVVTGATSGVTAASTTTVTADELIDLQESVPEAYRNDDTAVWMTRSISAVRKLQDANDQYLWQPGLQAGTPSTILGSRYVTNPDMPAAAAAAKSWVYGNFAEAYAIRDVNGVQMLRLNERYADYFQVGFVAFHRSDGVVQNASAIRALTQAAA